MIKVQGLARRRTGMSHADCVEHHRNFHSKLGLGQAQHMGGYVLYYFHEALGSDGAALPEFPWDMSALEWFREPDYWNNFQKWLESAPEGQEVKEDEANFLEREKCFLCPYEEQIVLETDHHGDSVVLLRFLTYSRLVEPTAGAAHHADVYLPAIRAHFGTSLRKLTINHITEATCLASGKIPYRPVDVIEIYKLDRGAFQNSAELVRAFAAPAIVDAEARIFAVGGKINMIAEEVVFIAPDRGSSHSNAGE